MAVQTGDPGLFPFFFTGISGLVFLLTGFTLAVNYRGLGERIAKIWINASPFRSRMLMSPTSLARLLGAGYMFTGLVIEVVAALQLVNRN
ncbi:hypothetical protein [Streptomyces sp. SS8]